MDPSRVYQHYAPGRLIFGPKSLNEMAKEIPAKEIALIVTQGGFEIRNSRQGDRCPQGSGHSLPRF